VVGCSLQAMIDSGGLVAVPAGCVEEGEIVVQGAVELGGGPFTVKDRITVQAGGELKFADAAQSEADVFVESGAAFEAVGSDIAFGGQLWVLSGGSARIEGSGGAGVVVDRLINQGTTRVAGLVQVGNQSQGIYSWLTAASSLRLGRLSEGSTLWFYQPTAAQAVALATEGDLGVAPAEAVFCDNGGCAATLAATSSGVTWLILTPGGVSTVEPRPTPTPSPTQSQQPTPTRVDLQTLIANAPSGSTLTVPPGTVIDSLVSVLNRDGRATSVTLTGGPVLRGYGGPLIKVPEGSSLTLRGIVIDGAGSFTGAVQPGAAAVTVAAGASLALDNDAVIKDNPSHGIVNAGELLLTGSGSGVTGCSLEVTSDSARTGSIGGAGVWNQAGGTFFMGGGRIADNTVTAAEGLTAFGGGVLNGGVMRVYGGSITGNAVDGDGGGIAVVRQAGAEPNVGGRLDFGGYAGQVASAVASVPELTANLARRGGGIVVVDKAEWGGSPTPSPQDEVPETVPSAVLDQGRIAGNGATEGGRGVAAYGGAALELSGPLMIEAPAQAKALGSLGVAVHDAYFLVSGDVLLAYGAGIGLLDEAWPVYLADGFTGSGQLVIEHVTGLNAGETASPIKWRGDSAGVSTVALDAIQFAVPGLAVSLSLSPDGEILATAVAERTAQPSPTPTQPSPQPSQPSPTPSPTPTPAPTATSTPTPAPTASQPSATASASGRSDGAETAPAETSAAASPSASATPSPSRSASKSPSPSPSQSPSEEETVITAPEPPAGASMRMLGFSLMAVGVFGLAVLGIYIMRRSGFFAA
jgi:outer membrane biosynthesis protein TonB